MSLDLLARLLFTRHEALLCALLEAVLDPPARIADVELLDADLPAETVLAKGMVLDVRVRLRDGSKVNVEVQNTTSPQLAPRMLFYWARHYVGDLRRGDGYEPLAPTIVILWLAEALFPEQRRFHSLFQLREATTAHLFTDHLALHVLELPHYSLDRPTRRTLQHWARFLAAETAEELTQLATEDAIMADARDAHAALSADPATESALRARQRMLEEAAIAEATGRHMARQEGLKAGLKEGKQAGLREGKQAGLREGKQEGLREGKQEGLRHAARRMVDGGMSVDQVAAMLGVTDDDVRAWLGQG